MKLHVFLTALFHPHLCQGDLFGWCCQNCSTIKFPLGFPSLGSQPSKSWSGKYVWLTLLRVGNRELGKRNRPGKNTTSFSADRPNLEKVSSTDNLRVALLNDTGNRMPHGGPQSIREMLPHRTSFTIREMHPHRSAPVSEGSGHHRTNPPGSKTCYSHSFKDETPLPWGRSRQVTQRSAVPWL